MEEIWVDIKDYEGLYQISNMGRVKSLERYVKNGINSGFFLKGIIRKPKVNNYGYYQIWLSKESKKKIYTIHQLVAIYFLNHTPNGLTIVVDHINGIKTDNRVENLQLVTTRENTSTCYRKDKKTFSSKYVGVSWKKRDNKWQSAIQINGKTKHLGYFDNELDASNAYQNKLKEVTP